MLNHHSIRFPGPGNWPVARNKPPENREKSLNQRETVLYRNTFVDNERRVQPCLFDPTKKTRLRFASFCTPQRFRALIVLLRCRQAWAAAVDKVASIAHCDNPKEPR